MTIVPQLAIKEFCETGSGGTPDRSNDLYYGGAIPWVKSGELREAIILDTEEKITDLGLKESSAKLVPSGSILLAMYGATVGRMALLGIDAATNQAICNIRPDPKKADARYVFHCLQSKVNHFLARAAGGAQPNISQGLIRETKLPLPPLNEQRRIAVILDKADDLRRKRKRALELLDGLTQSIFLEMFGDEPNHVQLKEICSRVTDGTHQAPRWASQGVPFLFVSNVRNQTISFETNKFVSAEEYLKLTKTAPIEIGDVLYTAVGSYGNAALVDTSKQFVFQRHIAHIKPLSRKVMPRYLSIALESPKVRAQADKAARGVAQKTVTLGSLKKFEIPLPPLSKQQKFVEKLECSWKAVADMRNTQSTCDLLFSSLQSRAFSGQL